MSYALEAHRAARKELGALPERVQAGLLRVLSDLAQNPRDARFDLRPIQGHASVPPTMRLRVGTYRVLLKIDHDARRIRVLRIAHRHTVYRGLDHLDPGI